MPHRAVRAGLLYGYSVSPDERTVRARQHDRADYLRCRCGFDVSGTEDVTDLVAKVMDRPACGLAVVPDLNQRCIGKIGAVRSIGVDAKNATAVIMYRRPREAVSPKT